MSVFDLRAELQKFQKNHFLSGGPREHLGHHGLTHLGIGTLKVPFQVKMTKMSLVNSRLTEHQNWLKLHQNNIFHVFTSNPRLSEIFINFTKFDLRLTSTGDRKANFDLTIQMVKHQCHYEEYQILFQMTAYGSKSELKRLWYLENCARHISSLLEAITFNPTIQFSKTKMIWKLDIRIFPVPPKLGQSKSKKAFKWVFKIWTENVGVKNKITNVRKRTWHTLSAR